MKHVIDATDKTLGRVAAEAARILLGKHRVDFIKNKVLDDEVSVINCSKAKILAKKKSDFVYTTYTGHRGGLKNESLGNLIDRKGVTEAFKRAIGGMVPKNKLYKQRIKNLTIKE